MTFPLGDTQPEPVSGRAPNFTHFEVSPAAVLAGEPVTVHWRTENAGSVIISTPDGFSVEFDARGDTGSYEFVAPRSGMVSGTAHGWFGEPARVSRPLAQFQLPTTIDVPIPGFPAKQLPLFGRTSLPVVDRSPVLAALLVTEPGRELRTTPVAAGRGGAPVATTRPPALAIAPVRSATQLAPRRAWSWFSLRQGPRQPVDLAALFTRRLFPRRAMPSWLVRRRPRRGTRP